MAITPRISEVGSFQFIRPGRNSDEPLTDQLARTPDSRLKAATNSPLQHSSSADDGTYREPVNRTLWQSDQSWTRFAGSLNDTEVINGVSPEGREQLVSASDSLNIPKDFRPGAVLTDLLARGVEAFSSTSGRYAYADDGVRPALAEVGSVRLKYGYQEEKFSLKLTTHSGKQLTLKLTHQSGWGQSDDGRALEVDQWLVDFSLDESLSKEEQEEALQLASSLDKLARRYLANGMLDLENLGLDKLQQFSAVSLDLKGAGGESSDLLRIEYRNDDEQRSLNVLLHEDKLKLDLSKAGWAQLGTEAQRQDSLKEYLTLIEQSGERGNADKQQLDLMLDAFALLHKPEQHPQDLARQEQEQPPQTPTGIDVGFARSGLTALSGLADFSFSFQAQVSKPNPDAQRNNEKISFGLNFAQDTRGETGDAGSLAVEQTQAYQFKASFYEPLPWLELVDFSKQNYQYIEIEARATEVTSLRYEDFTLQHASQQSQNEWHERRRTYVLGSLDSDVSEGDKNQDITDFTEAAILAEREQQQQLLDDLLGSRIPQPWQR